MRRMVTIINTVGQNHERMEWMKENIGDCYLEHFGDLKQQKRLY